MKKIPGHIPVEYIVLAILIAVNLVIGALTLTHYGESWDEFNYYFHSQQALSAYTRLFTTPGQPVVYDPTLRFYGPSFGMLIVLISKFFPGVILSDIAHGVSFITFQAGQLIFYLLARRWLKPYAALGATLSFTFQPLLWGHAFINSKDTSFMVGFLASIYWGLKMVDHFAKSPDLFLQLPSSPPLRPAIVQDWAHVKPAIRGLLFAATLLIMLMAGVMTFGIFWVRNTYFPLEYYDPHTIELEHYLYRILTNSWQIALFSMFFIAGISVLYLSQMPSTRKAILEQELRPFGRQFRRYIHAWPLILAGLFLGFTTSIRFMALGAGGLVGLYALWKHGRACSLYLVAYLLMTALWIFLTWPYLWGAPIFRFLLTGLVMLRFPWSGQVLFDGQYYESIALPWDYIARLILFQITIPVLLFALAGFLILVLVKGRALWTLRSSARKSPDAELFYWVSIWFIVPLVATMIAKPALYDNFRQLHFILPPLFLLSGVAIEFFYEKVKPLSLRILLFALIILPGVVGHLRLFPYEYTYYNPFAGQVDRNYELDYWGTSFREAAGYLNSNVPQGGKVQVWGPITTVWAYLRPDIQVYRVDDQLDYPEYYALILIRNNADLVVHPDLPNVFTVESGGALLAVIKKVP